MTSANQLLHEFSYAAKRDDWSKLPGPTDDTFVELTAMYRRTDATERARVRESVDDDIRPGLVGMSDRLAVLADRNGDPELLYAAILAHSIEDFHLDDRESIRGLAIVNHVANKLGVDAPRLFERAAALSSSNGADQLRAFLDRPEELKSIDVMGVVEEDTPDGVSYRFSSSK